ncbi:hypothetical protein D7V94_22000 [Parablautia intestinalis]|uniref:Uncharacterized protein n=1 Tax=Parablautia intestinalis TaxID=2320100 RepID=A0A3A9AHP7_9FIRM|nr:hypothetical protein [Parablautia intestinalis]RKI86956.1 hypothetical protein D7V94_22000 [Parablautia intestinalis]
MKKLFLNNAVIRDTNLSDYEVAVYVALRSLYDSQKELQYVDYNSVVFELYKNLQISRRYLNHIKSSLDSLVEKGLIKKVDSISNTEFIIDMSNLHFEQNAGKGIFYTVITLEEVHRIMNIDTKKDNFAILRYFIILISSICYDKGTYDHSDCYGAHTDFVGFMTLDTLADWCGTTKARIIEYNSILETEKMIYTYRHSQNKKDKKTGQIMSFSNHYGRYEDKQWIIQFANEYVATYNLKETETLVKAEKSKINKRYAAIFNLLVKDFDKYIDNFLDAELIGTYKYIHNKNLCNEKKLREIEEGTVVYDDIIGKIKNEDLFDDIPCVVAYVNRIADKKRSMEKRKQNLANAVSVDDNWGEPVSMKNDYSIEEILNMPVMGEVQPDYIETNNFSPSVRIGEPKVSADKEQNLKISDIADDESHDNSNHGIFCVTGKDLDCIDIDDLY